MINLFHLSHHLPNLFLTSVVNPGHLNMENDHSNLCDSQADFFIIRLSYVNIYIFVMYVRGPQGKIVIYN